MDRTQTPPTDDDCAAHRWALVLAAGEGSRVSGLTRNRYGIVVPKQFCRAGGGPSLLALALARGRRLVPRDRLVAIVARQHRPWWEPELGGLPGRNVVVQPANRGTAFGVLLPTLAILERDPDADVLLLPSDHYVQYEPGLARVAARAFAQVRRDPDRLVLLGIAPESAETGYGWIVPGGAGGAAPWAVARFVEKPSPRRASALFRGGALWSSFLLVGRGSTLLAMARERLPESTALLEDAWRRHREGRPYALDLAYSVLANEDFSGRILQGFERRLSVMPLHGCGWDDLGTPERVARRVGRLVPPDRPLPAPLSLRPAAGIDRSMPTAALLAAEPSASESPPALVARGGA